jgi:hypothetical protein
MADSADIPQDSGQKLPAKRSKKSLWADITQEGQALTPWQKEFAQWEALNAGRRKRNTEHERAATKAAGYPVPSIVLNQMRARADYREYLASIQGDLAKLARERVLADQDYYITKHKEALEKLIELGDYRSVAKFTMPMIGLAVPRKVEQTVQSTRISVTVGQSPTAKLLEGMEVEVDEAPVVEYEIVADPEEPDEAGI